MIKITIINERTGNSLKGSLRPAKIVVWSCLTSCKGDMEEQLEENN